MFSTTSKALILAGAGAVLGMTALMSQDKKKILLQHKPTTMAKLSKAKIISLAAKAGFPDPKLAAAIAMAESGGHPDEITYSSREYSVGLWQVNMKAWPMYTEAELKDPAKNAAIAFHISKQGRHWVPWTAFTSGAYKKYLT